MSEETKNNTPIEEDDEIITFTFDDGTSENYYSLAELDYEGKWYLFVEPVDPPEDFDDGDFYVFEIAEDEEGNEVVLPVEDEKLLQKLEDLFLSEVE